jgi:hypothetical protein
MAIPDVLAFCGNTSALYIKGIGPIQIEIQLIKTFVYKINEKYSIKIT